MKIKLAANSKSDEGFYKILSEASSDTPGNHLAFLKPNTRQDLQNFFSGTPEQIESKLSNIDTLRELWESILVEAIYFLRINDGREAPFYDKSDNTNKTTMQTKGVEDVCKDNVYGIEELTDYFKQFAEFESTLYGADKYYRDHIIHPLNVWVIGLHLLKQHGKDFKLRVINSSNVVDSPHAKDEWVKDGEGNLNISTAELSAMWAIIALTHDIGYPLEKVEKVNDQLEKMLSRFGNIGFSRSRFNFETQHDHLVRFLLKLISSVVKKQGKANGEQEENKWRNHLRTKYHTKFSKSWEMFDHGIVSSLILMKTLTFFIETDYSGNGQDSLSREDARQFAVRSEILHTIASHTTPKIYHLDIHNLPFLLVLCDDIQEWSRPTLSDMRAGVRGNAKEVEIKKFVIAEKSDDPSDISCVISYDALDHPEQVKFVKRVFKVWSERFRPALDDKTRNIKFQWELKFGHDSPWTLTLDNTQNDMFDKLKIKGPDSSNKIQSHSNLSAL